jgi:hypothetical protein
MRVFFRQIWKTSLPESTLPRDSRSLQAAAAFTRPSSSTAPLIFWGTPSLCITSIVIIWPFCERIVAQAPWLSAACGRWWCLVQEAGLAGVELEFVAVIGVGDGDQAAGSLVEAGSA